METAPYKILLIDDDPFLLDMYTSVYKNEGCSVETFRDANGDLVQRVLNVNPDAISLDAIMSGRDGWEALELLKQDLRTRNIPIFMASNQGQQEDIERSMELGAVDHIVIASYTPREVILCVIGYLENPSKYIPIKRAHPYIQAISWLLLINVIIYAWLIWHLPPAQH